MSGHLPTFESRRHLNAVPYNLARPRRLRPAEMGQVRALGGDLARALGRLLAEYLDYRLGVEFEGVVDPYPPAGGDGEKPRAWVVPTGLEENHAPRWSFSWPLASALIDLMIGSCPQPASSPGGFTRAEARLMAHLCEQLHETWAAVWPLRIVSPGPWRCLRDLAPPLCDCGASVALAYRFCGIGLENPDADDTLCYLHLPLELARLPVGQGSEPSPPPSITADRTLNQVRVQATVTLGLWRTCVRDLLALRPGQVVSLSVRPDDILTLAIAGTARMGVRAGIYHGRVAVQVVNARPDNSNPAAAEFDPFAGDWQALYDAEGRL